MELSSLFRTPSEPTPFDRLMRAVFPLIRISRCSAAVADIYVERGAVKRVCNRAGFYLIPAIHLPGVATCIQKRWWCVRTATCGSGCAFTPTRTATAPCCWYTVRRSEERRVGKECRSRGG